MKNLSTGTGLALLAGAILAWPILDRIAPSANASAVTAAAAAVSAAATAQTGPTIVWYQAVSGEGITQTLYRAWSDGRVEMRRVHSGANTCCGEWSDPTRVPYATPWYVISDPAQGLTFRSDINFDEKVDGADLGLMLAAWGPVTRNPVPPSDCPLALINP